MSPLRFLVIATLMLTANAEAADTRVSIASTIRNAFGISADDVYSTKKDGAALRDEDVVAKYRMLVMSAGRATLHQICLTSDSRFLSLETFVPANEATRARFEAFLIENLGKHGVDRALVAKLPTPVSVSVERVNCFSDASDAVLGLTYAEGPSVYFKIEVAVADFN